MEAGEEEFEGGVSPPSLGGHPTFQISSLLRYIIDIVKSSPNPNFFLKFNEN